MSQKYDFKYEELTEKVIEQIFRNNSDRDILDNMSSDSINNMYLRTFGHYDYGSDKDKVTEIRAAVIGVTDGNTAELATDTRKVFDTLGLYDAITVRALKDDAKTLSLQVLLNNAVVLEEKLSQMYDDWEEYSVENIGSGVSSAGDYYLSIGVVAEEDSDTPYAIEAAIIVKKDGKAELVSLNPWSNDEYSSQTVFDKDNEKFIEIHPSRR